MSIKILEVLQKYCSGRKLELDHDKVEQDLSLQEDKQQEALITKSHDLVNRIAVEVVAEPFTPDAHGHWYSKDTVEKGFSSFDKAWKEGRLNMNLFHSYDDTDKQNVELLKHYIVPFDCEVNGQKVKEGTWVAEVKYHNEELWKMRTVPNEKGEYAIAGLSLKGWGKINSPVSLEKATTDDVKKDDNGNLVYRGTKFAGYNKPMRSNREGKQGMVLAKKGDEIKVVHFGDPSLPDNQSKEQYDAFVARFSGQAGWDDPFSALYWSRKWLWPSSQIGEGAKEFYTLK